MSRVRPPLPAPESGGDHPGLLIPGFLLSDREFLAGDAVITISRYSLESDNMDREIISSLVEQ